MPIVVIEDGMVNEVRPEQSRNAASLIVVIEDGMVRSEQSRNAASPIVITEDGMVSEVKPEQL